MDLRQLFPANQIASKLKWHIDFSLSIENANWFVLGLFFPCRVICFDHRKSVLSRVQSIEDCGEKVRFTVDVEKSSSTSVYEYFSKTILDNNVSSSSR